MKYLEILSLTIMLYSWKIAFKWILIVKLLIINKSDYFTHKISNNNLFIILIFSSVVEFHKSLATKYRSRQLK